MKHESSEGVDEGERDEEGQVWDILTTAQLDQIQRRMSTGVLPDVASSLGLSRSTSLATESVLGGPAGPGLGGTTLTDCAISKPEFVSVVCQVAEGGSWEESAGVMFDRASRGATMVRWSHILDFYIRLDKERSSETVFQPLHHDGDFKAAQHSRRETIVKIIPVSTGTSYVFIITSKYGHVGIYDDKLRVQRRYEIDIDTDPDSDLDVAASDPGWITDAVWMDNSKHMVYTSSLRTIHFFDASASVHYEEYRGFGLRNIPLCIDYWFNPKDEDGESLLMFGDDGGSLTIIRFSQPPNSLFKKDEVDSVQTLFWSSMEKHSEFATVQYNHALHKDGINGIKYLAHNKTVVTSSRDPLASIIITHISNKFDPYVFKLAWGVRCFDIQQEVGILATGSNDMMVRLWNPVVTSRPTSVLGGHKAGIIDIKIHSERRFVFSYGKDAVVKVWDLDKATMLQTLGLHFPSFSVLGKEIEFGRPGMYIETGVADTILVICCEHMTELRLLEEVEGARETEALLISKTPEGSSEEKTASSSSELVTTSKEAEEEVAEELEKTKVDMTKVVQVELLKGEQEEQELPEGELSGWASTREIIARRRIKRLEVNPDRMERQMPDFSQIPLPEYKPFKIFREPQIGVGEKTLNQLRVEKYLDTTKFKQLAKDNMPFMALEIHGLQEVEIAAGLPLSENMINRGLSISCIDDLMAANLDWRLGAGGPGAGEGAGTGEARGAEQGEQGGQRRGSRGKQGGAGPLAKSLSPISEPNIDEDDD